MKDDLKEIISGYIAKSEFTNFMNRSIVIMLAFILYECVTIAQTVKVIGMGEGKTRDEAVHRALRESLERTYNSFLSSSTLFSDDEIVSDEIAVITRGNIVKYDILYDRIDSISKMHNAMVEAIVSLQKFKEYAQSHGSKVELDGNSLAQSIVANERMKKFNEENELKAVKMLINDLVREGNTVQIYDYTLKVELPQKASADNRYKIKLIIDGRKNINYYVLVDKIVNALNGISSKEGSISCFLNSFMEPEIVDLFTQNYWLSYYRDGDGNKPIKHMEDSKKNTQARSLSKCPLCGKRKFEDWSDEARDNRGKLVAYRKGAGKCHDKNCGYIVTKRDFDKVHDSFTHISVNLWSEESREWLKIYLNGGGGGATGLLWKRKFNVVDNNMKVYSTKLVYPYNMSYPDIYHDELELNLTYDELSKIKDFSVDPIRGIPLK